MPKYFLDDIEYFWVFSRYP